MEQHSHPRFGRSSCEVRRLDHSRLTVNVVRIVGVLMLFGPMSCFTSLPPYWYDPPCQKDFSWTTRSGETQQSKFVSVDTDYTDQAYCPNPLAALPDSTDETRYPPPVENLQLSYYQTEFKYSDTDYSYWAGLHSAMNINFQLGPAAAGKVSGVLFSMEGLSPDFTLDFKKLFCRAYRFVPPLELDALYDLNNRSMQFFFDCFRGQEPGMLYEYTIRTLPVMDTSGKDPYDTVVKFRYRSPSCYLIPDDFACKQNTQQPPADIALCSYWKPQFFTVSASYRSLTVFVELGPEDCGFDSYKIAVNSVQNATLGNWGNNAINIHADNCSKYKTSAYERNITYVSIDFKDVAIGQRVVMVTPTPVPNSCFDDDGFPRSCSMTLSGIVNVIENPCVAHPCSALEICKPLEADFICVCKPGYIRNGYICIKNPCEMIGNVTYNPCGHGTCIVQSTGSYYCNCTHGFIYHQGTCTVDKCLSASCAPHGTCRYITPSRHTTNQPPFVCDCSMGYQFDASNMSCQVSTVVLATVAVISLVLAVLLLLLLVCWRRRHSASPYSLWKAVNCWSDEGSQSDFQQMTPPSDCSASWQMPGMNANPSTSPPSSLYYSQEGSSEKTEVVHLMQRVRILLLHTIGDHPKHDDAVEKLAIFLQQQCMCDVIFPPWCWQNIQKTGLNMWLSQVLQVVTKVIVLCSKGTRVTLHAPGPQDVLGHALPIILADRGDASVSSSDKYAIAYLDYSSRDHVPPPLCVSAVFCLMKHMDELFFRLHGLRQNSAESRLRAHQFEETSYSQTSGVGAELYAAIQDMHSFQKEKPDWYEQCHPSLSHSDTAQDSMAVRAVFPEQSQPVTEEEFDDALATFRNMHSEV